MAKRRKSRVTKHTLAREESLFRYLMREFKRDLEKFVAKGQLSQEAFDAFFPVIKSM